MTIRSDISVNWDVSPRIITVASGSNELTIQDLHDTCRYLESRRNAVDNPYLIDTAGREFLGGTTYVGLTATLRNAVVAFEARPGPEWELCQILGGNLVAIDDAVPPNYIDPRTPTAYTTVDRTASSAATLQDQAALRYSSYQNAIWLDVEGSASGRDYPIGTREYPVNNLTDAISIANEEGFKTLQILSSMTFDNGTNIEEFEIIGRCKTYTEIIIEPSSQSGHVKIQNCNVVSGTLDMGTHIENCTVGNINNLNGHIHHSGLYGDINLGGGGNVVLADCFTNDQDSPVIIDMGGSGQDLSMPNYAGLITIKNLTSVTEEIGIGLNAGMVVLESTITAGTVIISGVGMCMDNTTGTANVNVDSLISKQTIAEATLEQTSITSGYVQGAVSGTNQIKLAATESDLDGAYDPSVISIQEGVGVGQARLIYQYDGATKIAVVDRDWKVNPDTTSKYIIHAHPGREHVNEGLAVSGTINTITLNTLASDINNVYKKQLIFLRGGTGADQTNNILSYNGTTRVAVVEDDWLTIPDNTTSYAMLPQHHKLTEELADVIWGTTTSGHTTPGTTGEALNDIVTNLERTLGLGQENYYIDQTNYITYGGVKLMTSGRMRIYSDAGSVGTGNNVIGTYQITASWSGDEMDDYKVVKL